MHRHRTTRTVAVLVVAALLAGCGGGGESPAPAAATAEGLWVGSTDTNQSLTGIVLDEGTCYILYSPPGEDSLFAGYLHGTGTWSGGTFVSDNARDFNFRGLGVSTADISGAFTQKQTFAGTVAYGTGRGLTFSASYDANYEALPLLSVLAGSFTGQGADATGLVNTTLSVSPAGTITGITTAGCTATGTVAPRPHGNIFDLSLTFGPTPCGTPNQTLTGVAYYSTATRRLIAAAQNGSRTEGFLFLGSKL